jgi:hypothetical protein
MSLLAELKRRRVMRVTAAYVVIAWAALGFPVVAVLAWLSAIAHFLAEDGPAITRRTVGS